MQPQHRHHSVLQRTVHGAILLLAVAGTTFGHAPLMLAESNSVEAVRHYQVKAGPLDSALGDFAGAAWVNITVPPPPCLK